MKPSKLSSRLWKIVHLPIVQARQASNVTKKSEDAEDESKLGVNDKIKAENRGRIEHELEPEQEENGKKIRSEKMKERPRQK